jgi:hypothetical protein
MGLQTLVHDKFASQKEVTKTKSLFALMIRTINTFVVASSLDAPADGG